MKYIIEYTACYILIAMSADSANYVGAAKQAYIRVINYINESKTMPTNKETIEAMRELSNIWSNSGTLFPYNQYGLEMIVAADNTAKKISPFFKGHADQALANLWNGYVEATQTAINRTIISYQGC